VHHRLGQRRAPRHPGYEKKGLCPVRPGTAPGVGVCVIQSHNGKNGNTVKEGCEVDHLISRELGGADATDNLWPQPYTQHPGAHEKDRLENQLHKFGLQ
jgi:5-methylcytosine-specific restriction endonuclease McrA